ncbi:Ig-like domain-containing protein [Synoicihabitans lomoniglobus]|uniref:Ig-like domain-containing protein n=1 Tax=Synoicihabitans lomoniglobus TaxID=2909285 RepID=A0AAF0A0R5_9BACT|nr:cadherin-like domain-containing protein [Opitutaceae bacterium LMO-M01]WED64417.1 Ig-like domain-containing protein [Opitutaceae bacterium LMO-M01]
MTFSSIVRLGLRLLALSAGLLTARVEAQNSAQPMQLQADGQGVSGQLFVSPEILSNEMADELVFTLTSEPLYGRVGLAGGTNADVFANKTARLGYFAYRPEDDYEGYDSFTYEVLNRTNGLVFANEVEIDVTPPPPLEMDSFEVSADRERAVHAVPVTLQTRPNLPASTKLPSHEDFMSEVDRLSIVDAKIAYVLDDKARPAHGTARLDRATGQLSYAPAPNFIGEDRFTYYTIDENNPSIGVENVVTISVEPIRTNKTKFADRSKSREVDLVFVINNSPSMAPHQNRIADNLRRFRQLFDERELDYRIGVLTTDFVNAGQRGYKRVRGIELDSRGQPVLGRDGEPRRQTKQVASNGNLVTLPFLRQPWITPKTPDSVFAELVRVGTNGDSNRTAFTAVYNFVAGAYNGQNALLRPEATTIVVFFMDEEETRMATWRTARDGTRKAEWVQNGKLPELLQDYNADHPTERQTLDGYINYWVLRPFIIVKGNQRGKIEMHAVVSPSNVSHRRAAELTGGTVLNIESDFSASLAELGDRIADTVAVALDPVTIGSTLYQPSLRVLVDGSAVPADPKNGYIYDELTHSIRFQGTAKKAAFAAKIEISYEEHR